MAQTIKLDDIQVGETKDLVIGSTLKSTGDDKNPTSATMAVWDPDQPTSGTADSGGASTLVDDARTEADDYWNGLPIEVTDATDGHAEQSYITDFVALTDTLTFGALSFAVAAGDTYRILGKPVLGQAACTVSGNEMSRAVTPANAASRPRAMHGYLVATYSASDVQTCDFRVECVGNAPPE